MVPDLGPMHAPAGGYDDRQAVGWRGVYANHQHRFSTYILIRGMM